MARFNLDEYELVETRISRFHETHEDGRIVTHCVKAGEDGKWLFAANVYLTAGDQAANLPKATGWASETEGGQQSEWKAELGETSAIGRALANMDLAAKKRSSREEMEKVVRADDVGKVLNAERDWVADAKASKDVEFLRKLYVEAKADKQPSYILKEIEKLAKAQS
tara:strand:+ start:3417 stop:3917 length:501 start_codon:yes stop_codon:yes gene_type:complete